MGKITLIIPDIHLRWALAERIIEYVKADENIFLGDYFDDFGDTAEMVRETCLWLEKSVNTENRIHLFGNHDLQYLIDNTTFRCSGYESYKHQIINDLISNKTRDKIKYYHILDDKWLMTHGGLHKSHIPDDILKIHGYRSLFLSKIKDFLDEEIINGHRNKGWIFRAGRSRGGVQNIGGITWCDHNREMFPVLGLNQIYGHTEQIYGEPSWIIQDSLISNPYIRLNSNFKLKTNNLDDTSKSQNLCLDVYKVQYWAIWNGKDLKIQNQRIL